MGHYPLGHCKLNDGALSSVGRAEPLQGLGREFEPLSAHH